jgi:predicted kinase
MNKFLDLKLAEEPRRGQLFFMVGLPRSGKSTATKKLEKEFDAVVLRSDLFRIAMYNSDYHEAMEPSVVAAMDVAARALLLSGRNVIIDDTHTRQHKRQHWLTLGGKGIYVNTPLEECLKRCDPEYHRLMNAMKRMDENLKNFDYKNPEENIDRVYDSNGHLIAMRELEWDRAQSA